MALKVVTYTTAGRLLGSDEEPLSLRTIERMVQAGDLERTGERRRRRITVRSIEAYQVGERGIWRENANEPSRTDEHPAPATQRKRRMAPGRLTIPDEAEATTSAVGLIRDRLPRRGVIPFTPRPNKKPTSPEDSN